MDKETKINELRDTILKDLKKKKMRPTPNADLNVVMEDKEFAGEHQRYTMLDRWDYVDKHNHSRFGYYINPKNDCLLVPLCDKNGKVRMSFVVDSTGKPSLEMRDKNEVVRLTIGLTPDGEPGIVFWNEKGKPCFVLGPGMLALGEAGECGFRLSKTNDLIGLRLHSRYPKQGICLAVSKNGEPTMGLTDSKGNAIWQPEIAPKKKPREKAKAA